MSVHRMQLAMDELDRLRQDSVDLMISGVDFEAYLKLAGKIEGLQRAMAALKDQIDWAIAAGDD